MISGVDSYHMHKVCALRFSLPSLTSRRASQSRASLASPATAKGRPRSLEIRNENLYLTMAQTLPAAIARNILYCHTRTLSSSRNQLPPCFRYRTPSRPAFSTTAPVLKKGKKPSSLSDDNVDAAVNPLDFSALQAAISRTIDQLKRQITETRKGPRDVAAIEGLRVSLVKNSKETVELGQLAQVVSRGRILAVMVGDREVRLIFLAF